MKRRTALLRVGVLMCSIALFAGYVAARGMGWIGRAEAPAEPSTPAPAAPKTDPGQPQEFFGGSKSAQVLTPEQAQPLLPSSKVMVLDPLPSKRSPKEKPSQAPAFPLEPK